MRRIGPAFLVALIASILLFVLGIGLGSSELGFGESLKHLLSPVKGNPASYIIHEIRLPRTIAALLAGMGLSVAGLIMQTLFSNPLAGPYVLGISSGASLMVAVFTITTGIGWGLGVPIAALIGALGAALIVLLFANMVRNPLILLIIGVMLASFSSALVSVLEYFAEANALKVFIVWSMGDFGQVTLSRLTWFIPAMLVGIGGAILCIKSLNAFILGERYVQSLGINAKSSRFLLLVITALLAGTATAFCGPIAFIGLAVPNLVRFMIKTANHNIMLPMVIVVGGAVGMLCDILARLPGYETTLPVNAISALIGAPVVIAVLLQHKNRGV